MEEGAGEAGTVLAESDSYDRGMEGARGGPQRLRASGRACRTALDISTQSLSGQFIFSVFHLSHEALSTMEMGSTVTPALSKVPGPQQMVSTHVLSI